MLGVYSTASKTVRIIRGLKAHDTTTRKCTSQDVFFMIVILSFICMKAGRKYSLLASTGLNKEGIFKRHELPQDQRGTQRKGLWLYIEVGSSYSLNGIRLIMWICSTETLWNKWTKRFRPHVSFMLSCVLLALRISGSYALVEVLAFLPAHVGARQKKCRTRASSQLTKTEIGNQGFSGGDTGLRLLTVRHPN